MNDTNLLDSDTFVRRHIGPDANEVAEMLATLGYESLDELIDATVPADIRMGQPLDLPDARNETEVLEELRGIASRNRIFRSYIGMGYYDTITPPVIQRNVLENPGWYTAYTPYQPEISQGRLEALLNFQQMVIDLTGMELANASMLDEATAAAEAMMLMHRVSRSKSDTCFVADDLHPQTIAVLKTRAEPLGMELRFGDPEKDFVAEECFGLILQYPNTYGEAKDHRALVEKAHAGKALVTVASDLLALALLTPPGEWGADVVVGSAQRFGVSLGYGGPHAGFMATRDEHKRNVPGRIVGVSVDTHGKHAYRLALQTREQHIRREKAMSNICTAQVLLAVMSGFYAVWHGPEGVSIRRSYLLTRGGYAKRTRTEQYRVQKRGGKGVLTAKLTDERGSLVGALVAAGCGSDRASGVFQAEVVQQDGLRAGRYCKGQQE